MSALQLLDSGPGLFGCLRAEKLPDVRAARNLSSMCSLGEVILARPWCALSIFWAETVFPLTEVTSKGSLEVCLVPSDLR